MKKRTAKEMTALVAELQAILPRVKALEDGHRSEYETNDTDDVDWYEVSSTLAATITKLID